MQRLWALLPLLAAGCCCGGPSATSGYRFEVLKPPQMYAPVTLSETAPQLAIQPIAAYPSAVPPRSRMTAPSCPETAPPQELYAPPPQAPQAPMGCEQTTYSELQELRSELRRLKSERLQAPRN